MGKKGSFTTYQLMIQIESKQRRDDIALEQAKESLKSEHACGNHQILSVYSELQFYSGTVFMSPFNR